MRWLVLLLSLAMPVVSWFSQQGVFGPTNGAISDRYPTLIVAAGYAFAIWGLIFLWDMVFGAWQAFSRRAATDPLAGIRPWAAAGFALTAVWMPASGSVAARRENACHAPNTMSHRKIRPQIANA